MIYWQPISFYSLPSRSEQNWSGKRRWAYLIAYNTKNNDPVVKHHHPCYTPMSKVLVHVTWSSTCNNMLTSQPIAYRFSCSGAKLRHQEVWGAVWPGWNPSQTWLFHRPGGSHQATIELSARDSCLTQRASHVITSLCSSVSNCRSFCDL